MDIDNGIFKRPVQLPGGSHAVPDRREIQAAHPLVSDRETAPLHGAAAHDPQGNAKDALTAVTRSGRMRDDTPGSHPGQTAQNLILAYPVWQEHYPGTGCHV